MERMIQVLTASPKLPMDLTATFTIRDRKLVMFSNGAVFEMQLAVEAAEWVWVDVLGDGARKQPREIPDAKAWLTDRGLKIQIGTLAIFRTMDSRKRGILADRQKLVEAGQAPAMWNVVQL
jgi:hypothetical protein